MVLKLVLVEAMPSRLCSIYSRIPDVFQTNWLETLGFSHIYLAKTGGIDQIGPTNLGVGSFVICDQVK